MKTSITKSATLLLSMAVAATSGSAVAAYTETAVTNGGSVSGKVTFKGNDPEPRTYAITKDNDTCGTGNRTIDFVKVNNGNLSDVVVYLDKVKEGKPFPAMNAEVDQKGCEFLPYLSVMHNTNSYDAINSDPVLHNIHTYEIIGRAKKTVFNVSQPNKGSITKQVKLKRGAAMKVECDAHDFMHGFVFVAKNPYYAVVGSDGTFKIDNVPAGTYTIKAWHGTLREQKGKVTIAANGDASFDFQFK